MMILVALGLGTKRHWHIFIAIFLGGLFGALFPVAVGHPSFMHQAFELVGEMFIRMVAMLAIPLIISSLLIGMASLGDGRQLGKLGLKTILMFVVGMLISGSIAAAIAYYVHPGSYISQNIVLQPFFEGLHFPATDSTHLVSLKDLLLNLIPQNPFESLAKRDLVPVIIFTLITGAAMASIGDTARPFMSFFESVFAATMRVVDWVMVFSVPGVFALVFTAISHSGIGIVYKMLPFMACLIMALLTVVMVVYPLALSLFARVNFLDLYRAISEAILVGFGTASSSATLPVTLACIERRAGVSNRIASFVVPAGISMNMNGTAMFEVTAVMFLAQVYGIDLTFQTIASIVVLAIVASVGAAGVPSAGLITMSIILNGIGGFRPEQVAAGLSLIWAVDRLLDMCRTTVNVIDDCVVATIVAAGEGELNRDLLTHGELWEDVVK